jgi:hypothetical protein
MMLGFLGEIVEGILNLPFVLVGLLIEAINGWIMILALAIQAILAVLPAFPKAPTLGGSVLSGVAWFLPIGAMLGVFATFVTAWVLWMAYSVILRWAKAL